MLFFSLMAILSLGLLASCDKNSTELEEDDEPTVEVPTESETQTPEEGDVLDKENRLWINAAIGKYDK